VSTHSAPLRDDFIVKSLEQLQSLYGEVKQSSIAKETPVISAHYRKFIEAAPFFALATHGPEGMDCSPRGDAPGFVRVVDEKTLMIPDRRGNNRIDSLRNLMHDPRVGLLFLIPGLGETFRVNGRAGISIDPELVASFAHEGKAPRCVLVVEVEAVYFQCSRAVLRARLWDPAVQLERKDFPSNGQILSDLTQQRFDGETYDRELPLRIARELYESL